MEKDFPLFGERITLILSCLSRVLGYFLSFFETSTSVALKIEKMQKDFLYLGSGEGTIDHLIN